MIPIQMKLPALMNSFKASYSSFERPSGIEYMILTIISTSSFQSHRWVGIMNSMGIPKIVFERIFCPELLVLITIKKMIVVPADIKEIDLTNFIVKIEQMNIGDMELTEIGKQAFSKGVIAENIKEFSGSIAYCPAESNEKYMIDSKVSECNSDESNQNRFSDIAPDEIMMENYIVRNKKIYGVHRKDAEVFGITFQSERMTFYEKILNLELSEISGIFTIRSNNQDENFIKSHYSAEELLQYLPEKVTELRDELSVSVAEWRKSVPNWENVSFCLPSDIRLNDSQLVLMNSQSCPSTSKRVVNLDIDAPVDIVLIDASGQGTEISLVNKKTSVEGLEGSVECHIAVRHRIGEVIIEDYVKRAVESIKPDNIDDLTRAIDITDIIGDSGKKNELLYIFFRNVPNLKGTLAELKQHSNLRWYGEIPDIVERIILEKGLDEGEIKDLLTGTELKIMGLEIVRKLSSDDVMQRFSVIDTLSPFVMNEGVLIHELNLDREIVRTILDCGNTAFSSKCLRSMSAMANSLRPLKSMLNIRSPSDYSFDITEINGEEAGRICSLIATLQKEEKNIHNLITDVEEYSELKVYLDFFGDLYQYLKPDKEKKKIDKLEIIELCVKLSDALRNNYDFSGDLADMLRQAREKNMITEEDYKILNELRIYRNECAHRMEVRKSRTEEKRLWHSAVKKLVSKSGGSQ